MNFQIAIVISYLNIEFYSAFLCKKHKDHVRRLCTAGGYRPESPEIGGHAPREIRIFPHNFDAALAFRRITDIMRAE